MSRESWTAPKKWTREEISTLMEMKKSGKTKWEIAQALDRSPNSVDGKLDDLKIFGHPDEYIRHSVKRSTDPDVSNDLLRERDRIAQMDTRTKAQIFLGEPHPMRSMLFKKTGQTV